MKIRSKLTVLLIAVTLLPLISILISTGLSIHRLSQKIFNGIGQTQSRMVVDDLGAFLANYRETIQLSADSLRLAVQVQANEIEKRLAQSTTDESLLLQDTLYGATADVVEGNDLMAPMAYEHPVNFSGQELALASIAQMEVIREDLLRLQSMTEVYQHLYSLNRSRTLWHYTALDNGFYASYPAGLALPAAENYDPRNRPWYVQAIEAINNPDQGDGVFSIHIDSVTRSLVLTISKAVFRADGKLAGVTAIDLPMKDIFKGITLPAALNVDIELILASLQPEQAGQPAQLLALMQTEMGQMPSSWQLPVKLPRLESQDHAAYRNMVEAIENGQPGQEVMEYQGQECIWVHSQSLDETTVLLLLVPTESIQRLAEHARETIAEEARRQVSRGAGVALLLIVIAIFLATVCSHRFTAPIHHVVHAAKALSDGDYDARASVRTGDELEELAATFNEVGPKLQLHEKTQQSLMLAGEIQQNLLPQKPPVMRRFDIAASCQYCEDTGGDYYDFIPLEHNKQPQVGIVLGDVTGHGVGAALLMASAKSILRNVSLHFQGHLSPVMEAFNDQLAENTGDDKFITLFFGVLNDSEGTLNWASGGHDPALWYRLKQDRFEELPNTGALMGYMAGMEYTQAGPVHTQPGDILLIGTDGIWEARNPAGDMYGKERLQDCIRTHAHGSAETIAVNVVQSVNDFIATGQTEDDITLIAIKARPTGIEG